MATRYDRERQQWVTEFEQTGIRVYRRHPKGIGKPQAEAWEVKRRREIYDRVDLEKKPELTIGEAIAQWLHENKRKNQRQAVSEAKQWEPFVGGKLLRDAPEVAAEATKQWTRLRVAPTGASRTARGVAKASTWPRPVKTGKSGATLPQPSTINRRLMLLKAVCKHAYKKGLHPENLSARIETLREPEPKERFLTHAEVRALVKHSPSVEVGRAILTLVYSGLRATELTSLTAGDLRRDTLSVLGKGDKRRSVPIPPHCLPTVRLAVPVGLSYWQLRKAFIRARKAAGIGPEVTLHTCRHTYASWFLQQGGDLYTLSKLMGHSTIYVTTRYGHLVTEHLRKSVANLK
jgi:integrase